MASRIVVYFNQANAGWSETFYTYLTDIPDDINSPAWQEFLSASLAMRAQPTILMGVRWTQLDPPNRSYFFPVGIQNFFANQVQFLTDGPPDVVATDAWFQWNSPAIGGKRAVTIRGLPDSFVTKKSNANPDPPANFVKAYRRYFDSIAALNLQMRALQRTTTGLYVKYPVQSVTAHPTNENWSVITTTVATGYNPLENPQVIFRGVPKNNLPGLPRITQVLAATAAAPFTITVPYRYRGAGPSVTPAKMTFQRTAYVQDNIGTYNFIRYSTRNTGRPFGSLRGRAKSVIRAR